VARLRACVGPTHRASPHFWTRCNFASIFPSRLQIRVTMVISQFAVDAHGGQTGPPAHDFVNIVTGRMSACVRCGSCPTEFEAPAGYVGRWCARLQPSHLPFVFLHAPWTVCLCPCCVVCVCVCVLDEHIVLVLRCLTAVWCLPCGLLLPAWAGWLAWLLPLSVIAPSAQLATLAANVSTREGLSRGHGVCICVCVWGCTPRCVMYHPGQPEGLGLEWGLGRRASCFKACRVFAILWGRWGCLWCMGWVGGGAPLGSAARPLVCASGGALG
jgi:hypothetical protein